MAIYNGKSITFGAQVNVTTPPVVQQEGTSSVSVVSQKAFTEIMRKTNDLNTTRRREALDTAINVALNAQGAKWSDTYNPKQRVYGFEIESLFIEEEGGNSDYYLEGAKVYNIGGDYTKWTPFEYGIYYCQIDTHYFEDGDGFDEYGDIQGDAIILNDEWLDGSACTKTLTIKRWFQPTEHSDFSVVLDELHEYAQGLISGVSE